MNDPGADRKAQTRAIFDRLAVGYDVVGPGCFAWFGRRLVEEVGIEPGARVLDVASGRGAVLLPAAEQAGLTGSVVGIDLSEEMVRIAKAELAQLGGSAQIHVMDAERLDFPDAMFDDVLCGFGVMFFPDLNRALGEIRRVLKPGGRLGISTWQISQTHDLAVVLDDLGLDGPGEPGWITDPDRLAELVGDAGFTSVRVIADPHTFRYDDIEQYWQNARGTGLRRRLDTLDAEQTERARAAFAQRVQRHQQPDGLYIEAVALLAIARTQDMTV